MTTPADSDTTSLSATLSDWTRQLPRASGAAQATAKLKSCPADFVVREQLNLELTGAGEHVFLLVRKCALNTMDVITELQRAFECSQTDIGYAGLKDKQAVTDQWFSIRSPRKLTDTDLPTADAQFEPPPGSFVIVEWQRHSRKLKLGAHTGNRFTIRLREIEAISTLNTSHLRDGLETRLQTLSTTGFPNYFGEQRFGFDAQNLVQAERHFRQPKRKLTRKRRSFYLSASRSALFNRVCAERVKVGTWDSAMEGEPMMLDGSNSVFVHTTEAQANTTHVDNSALDDTTDKTRTSISKRCEALDIHPTGPLFGQGVSLAQAQCEQFEAELLQPFQLHLDGLCHAGMKQQRRALRAKVNELSWEWDGHDLLLDFSLSKGSFATVLLSELVTQA